MYSTPYDNNDPSNPKEILPDDDDKYSRLQSRIQSARGKRSSIRRTSSKDSTGKKKAPSVRRRSSLEEEMKELDPRQILDLLEVSAQDNSDYSNHFLTTLKNSSSGGRGVRRGSTLSSSSSGGRGVRRSSTLGSSSSGGKGLRRMSTFD